MRLRKMPVRTVVWPMLRTLWHGHTLVVNGDFDGSTLTVSHRSMVCYSTFRNGSGIYMLSGPAR